MDQKKEQAKVRERILKVFRARAQSPGGGPAIIVSSEPTHQSKGKGSHTNIQTNEFPKYALDDSDDFLLSDGHPSPIEVMEKTERSRKDKHQASEKTVTKPHTRQHSREEKNHSHGQTSRPKKSQQREKRKKSRSERNKTRSQKQQQVNPLEREEFRKHVKKAKEITSHSNMNVDSHSDDQVFSAITQNRLTRQAGIYNKGKKSHRLYKDPLRVSQWVSDAVEKEMKTIVVDNDESRINTSVGSGGCLHRVSSMESLPTMAHTPVIKSTTSNRIRSSANTGCMKALRRTKSSDSGTAMESCPPSAARSHSSVDQTSQVFDMSDLSAQLKSCLDVRQLFPGTDYAAEMRCELHKLMKSNCSGKSGNAESFKEYLKSLSSKEADKTQSSHSLPDHPNRVNRNRYQPSSAVSVAHHATACVQHDDAVSVHHSQDEVILMDVPQATEASQPDAKHTDVQMSHATTAFTDNALQLFQFAEKAQTHEIVATTIPKTHQRRDNVSTASSQPMELGQPRDPQQQQQNSYLISHQASPYTVNDARDYMKDDYKVRTSLYDHYDPPLHSSHKEDEDRYHGLFLDDQRYQHRHHKGPHGYARYSVLPHQGISTDIIDDIEFEQMEVTGPSPSFPECRYPTTSAGRHHDRHHTRSSSTHHPHQYQSHRITQLKKCEDSDSESSPLWCPAFVSPIQKPKLESPSPPELYPQRMF